MYDASTPRYFPIGRMRRMTFSNATDGLREEMRNDVVFVAGFYAIAMRINVTDGGYMTTCRDTHFAVASEKAYSCRNAFFKKAVLLFVELSEAVCAARFLLGEFRSETRL